MVKGSSRIRTSVNTWASLGQWMAQRSVSWDFRLHLTGSRPHTGPAAHHMILFTMPLLSINTHRVKILIRAENNSTIENNRGLREEIIKGGYQLGDDYFRSRNGVVFSANTSQNIQFLSGSFEKQTILFKFAFRNKYF